MLKSAPKTLVKDPILLHMQQLIQLHPICLKQNPRQTHLSKKWRIFKKLKQNIYFLVQNKNISIGTKNIK